MKTIYGLPRSPRPGALLLAMAVFALSGCVEDSESRPPVREKGIYSGAPDSALSDEQVDELRQRAQMQRGI